MEPQHYTFALEWLANGQNGRQAYKVAYPQNVQDTSADTCAWRLLRSAKVRAFLGERLDVFWKAQQLSAEQIIAQLGHAFTADPAELFIGTKLKDPSEWDHEQRVAVESVDFDRGKVKLISKAVTGRLLLEASGRLKTEAQQTADALAEAMKRDRAKHLKDGADA